MRKRLLKSLRIAVTAVSLLVCGLLLVLWVRSYSFTEAVFGQVMRQPPFVISSDSGVVDFIVFRHSQNIDVDWHYQRDLPFKTPMSWRLTFWSPTEYIHLRVPHWFLITLFATIAALPWIKWRFSLRTLLIVLTLFALFFGAIAMSM